MKMPLLAGRDFNETDTYPDRRDRQSAVRRQILPEPGSDRPDSSGGRADRKGERYGIVGRHGRRALSRHARGDSAGRLRAVPRRPIRRDGCRRGAPRSSCGRPASIRWRSRHNCAARCNSRDQFRAGTIQHAAGAQRRLHGARAAARDAGDVLRDGRARCSRRSSTAYGVSTTRWRSGAVKLASASRSARAGDIARRVTLRIFSMVVTGAAAGLALGLIGERYRRAADLPGEGERSGDAGAAVGDDPDRRPAGLRSCR